MTGKLNNAQNSTVIKFFKKSTKSSKIHVQCQRKQRVMSET